MLRFRYIVIAVIVDVLLVVGCCWAVMTLSGA